MDWSWVWMLPRWASWDALVNCGMTIAARMPRITTTMRISTSVKALRTVLRIRDTPCACTPDGIPERTRWAGALVFLPDGRCAAALRFISSNPERVVWRSAHELGRAKRPLVRPVPSNGAGDSLRGRVIDRDRRGAA